MIDNTRSVLNKREVMIIAMRFVLAGYTDNTLEEAGQNLDSPVRTHSPNRRLRR